MNDSDKEWDLWCREASYAYSSSVHSSTGFTPAKIMFGRDYSVPIDIIYNVAMMIEKSARSLSMSELSKICVMLFVKVCRTSSYCCYML